MGDPWDKDHVAVRGPHEATLLHFATMNRRDAAVRFLLERKAQVDARDVAGQTPLHIASLQGDAASTAALLAFNSPIEARNKNGQTALHLAVMLKPPVIQLASKTTPPPGGTATERLEVVKALQAAGADTSAKTLAGQTPFDLALAGGTREIARLVMPR